MLHFGNLDFLTFGYFGEKTAVDLRFADQDLTFLLLKCLLNIYRIILALMISTATATSSTARIALSLCTDNVLFLYRAPDGHAGRLGYIAEQFLAHALLLGGLQETRTPQGSCTCGKILRLCSGAEGGQGGVELWVNLQQPYGHNLRTPLFFKQKHFQVLHHDDAHRLLVRLQAPFVDFVILVGHAPHGGRPEQFRQQLWTTTTNLLNSLGCDAPLLVLMSASAEPGDFDGKIVFSEGLSCSRSTPLWRDFRDTFNLCLPQTASLHQGGLATWTSPGGLSTHCMDYVAVPQEFIGTCSTSQLLAEFDLGTERLDHAPIAIDLTWSSSRSKNFSTSV